jgi:peptidoglycan/xylan/chitin deacetylase (PgdA/CDA1 family)
MSHRISHPRWYVKKAARRGLATTAWASGWLAAAEAMAGKVRLRVLTYHRLGDSPHDPFCVRPSDFEVQMRYLAERRLAVSLADLEAMLIGQKQLPRHAVLVTVDDGFRSVYTEMLPILRHYAIPAVAYVSPGLLRDSAAASTCCDPSAGGPEEYLTWDQLAGLAAGGVTIGSHGWTHRSLGRMPTAEALDEAVRSRETLRQRLGCRVGSFAYPYGTRADFSPATAETLVQAGYCTAFTSQHGAIARGADPMALPRIKVEGGEGLLMFRLLCRGAMDGWRLVDHALWRVQRAGR